MQPSLVDVNALGQLEGYTHQASLIYINNAKNITVAVVKLNESLSTIEGISFGVSALPINGLLVRLLGYKADQLHNILKQTAKLLQSEMTKLITEQKEEAYAS